MDATEAAWLGLLDEAERAGPDPALTELCDSQVEQEVRDGAARVAAATCQYLVHVAELVVRGIWADQHARTPAEWLSWACGVAPSTAREQVRVGLRLRTAPLIRARFAAGTISYSKVRAITRVVAPEVEQHLLDLADSAPAAQLERIIAGCRRQLSEDERWARGPEDEAGEVRDFDRRELDVDTVEFRIRLPVDAAAAFQQRVDRLVDLADRADREDQQSAASPDGAGNEEPAPTPAPIGIRRATAVADALGTAVAAGPPDRSGTDDHVLVLHADVDDLVEAASAVETGDAAEAPADSPRPRRRHVVTGRGRSMSVPRWVLAELACDAELRLAGIHGHGDCTHPADIGRRKRKVPAELRRALQLRDRHCRFPGCHRTRSLHAHHVRHWADGGPTEMANLVLVCRQHHRLIHRQGWRLEAIDAVAGRWLFHAPGTTAPHPAAPPLPGASAEAVASTVDQPHPVALQPPWWDGEAYDLSETIRVVSEYLADLSPAPTDLPPHPALAA